ncbi:hypothetical protein A1O3_04397 [Capronia epimyces CBS 606.96]|uniref:Major facilitator superfamily (MFS) profile domain-containing protein n=1 Tax=Capronia epimyces CBS 606.96 TaxID=1182542 RepID=W9Y3R1_9EURO|nr:uncharacterized protein A1O3_04397 [Capronia epimyces CBS 606.96]EXJ87437.1 hypothetical protein A1O3_04397 [Capronia epimyces CBS 606.96]
MASNTISLYNNQDSQAARWQESPANPHNWPLGKKLYHTSICASYAFTITFMSSVYASGYKEVMQQFHVSSTLSLLGVSLFCLGLAFGPIIAAPLSETLGRLVIYRISLLVAGIFIVGAALSNSLAALLVCRFFAGLFGSPALSIGGGTIADIWPPIARIRATSMFVLAPNLGPSLGPVLGGFVAENKGWRWLEWVGALLAAVTYVWALGMEETYQKTILRKIKKNEENDGSNTPKGSSGQTLHLLGIIKEWLSTTLGRPLVMLLTEPIVLFFSLYVALSFGILYSFFAAVPLCLAKAYGFDDGRSGLAFVAIAVGCLLATITAVGIDLWLLHNQQTHQIPPSRRPETILFPAILGSLGLPTGLFWFGWTVRQDIHWASPVCALVVFAWGNLCIFSSAVSYLINSYGPFYGASALAANSFARYGFAAATPLFTVQMYEALEPANATSILGGCSALMLPIPWILYRWGPTIRRISGRAITSEG